MYKLLAGILILLTPSADITALIADLLADLIIGTSISNFHYRSR